MNRFKLYALNITVFFVVGVFGAVVGLLAITSRIAARIEDRRFRKMMKRNWLDG